MNLVYIHGHAASMKCFNFIRKELGHSKEIFLEYDSNDGFARNYAAMLERVRHVDQIFFIAHSIGGIYALHLAHALGRQVVGAVTLSTPYGGSTEAGYLQIFSAFHPILRDVHPYSRPISDGNKLSIVHPWTAVVTTAGHYPFTIEPNDGVVTLKSMRHRKDLKAIELRMNHYQVLRSAQAVDIIRNAMGRAKLGLHHQTSRSALAGQVRPTAA